MNTSASDSLLAGFAYFNGGSTAATLTKGGMGLTGLYQGYNPAFAPTGGSATAFAPSGTRVTFATNVTTPVAFHDPGTGALGSHFWFVQSRPTTSAVGVILKSDIFVDSLMLGEASNNIWNSDALGTTIRTITTNGIYNSGTSNITFGAVSLVLNQGVAASTFFQSIVWNNFPAVSSGAVFTQNRTSAPPTVNFQTYTGISFTGTGNFATNTGTSLLTFGSTVSPAGTCVNATLSFSQSCK
jgi:hypothetical protein